MLNSNAVNMAMQMSTIYAYIIFQLTLALSLNYLLISFLQMGHFHLYKWSITKCTFFTMSCLVTGKLTQAILPTRANFAVMIDQKLVLDNNISYFSLCCIILDAFKLELESSHIFKSMI